MTTLTVIDFDDTLLATGAHMDEGFFPALQQVLEPHRHYEIEELEELNELHYTKYGASIHGWAEELGQGREWVLNAFADMAPALVKSVMPHIHPNAGMKGKLKDLQARGHTLAILTHGHRDYAMPLLEKAELTDIFPGNMVFDIASVGAQLKRTEDPYRHVLNALAGRGPFLRHNMVEDSAANLPPAKRLGFTTWLVGESDPPPATAAFIDHHLPAIDDVLNALLEV